MKPSWLKECPVKIAKSTISTAKRREMKIRDLYAIMAIP
jgi:hypothetical protein